MRLVTLEELVKLPKGTIFTKYPLGVHEMIIKDENVPTFYFREQRLSDAEGDEDGELFDPDCITTTGKDFKIDLNYPDVDTSYNEDTLFIVYSQADVQAIIERLGKAVNDVASFILNAGK